jgi:hypothetical protein
MDTSNPGRRIMITAGEASGVLHNANLAREQKLLDNRNETL